MDLFKNFNDFMKKNKLLLDILNVILGVALIVLLALAFSNPGNKYYIFFSFLSGGLINLSNGLKLKQEKARKSMGITSIMLGIIIIAIGFLIMNTDFLIG
jgi:uncharacterized membrane protein